MALIDRLSSAGSKRVLALDGGGIRGSLTVGFLIFSAAGRRSAICATM